MRVVNGIPVPEGFTVLLEGVIGRRRAKVERTLETLSPGDPVAGLAPTDDRFTIDCRAVPCGFESDGKRGR